VYTCTVFCRTSTTMSCSPWFNQNSKHRVLGSNSTPTLQSWVKLTLALPPPIPLLTSTPPHIHVSTCTPTMQPRVNQYSKHEVMGWNSTTTTQSCVNQYSNHIQFVVLCWNRTANHTFLGQPVLQPHSSVSTCTPTMQPRVNQASKHTVLCWNSTTNT